jgi:hypothetical protein
MRLQTDQLQSSNRPQHETLVNDTYVLKKVFSSYENFLQLNMNRPPECRTPLMFIGKIQRTVMSLPTNDISKSLDVIYIYKRNLQLQGWTMPICHKIKVITSWKNGTPVYHSKWTTETTTNSCLDFLCSLPIFSLTQETKPVNYDYFISREDIQVGYSDFYSKLLQNALRFENLSPLCKAYSEIEDLFSNKETEDEEDEESYYDEIKFNQILKCTVFENNPLQQVDFELLAELSQQEDDSEEEEEEEEEDDDDDEDGFIKCKYSKFNKAH